MAAMSLGVAQPVAAALLDGPQALDGAWALDGSGAATGVMTFASVAGAVMARATAGQSTMTGA